MFINLEKFIKKDENIKNKISEILNKCGSTYKIEEVPFRRTATNCRCGGSEAGRASRGSGSLFCYKKDR